jgi:glyoxylase-like metal-dependent hydrolase (beta-lactamase superfamily II)
MSVTIRLMTCGWLGADAGMLARGSSGRVRLPIPSVLIEHPRGRALFDTGLHADLAHDTSRLRTSAQMFEVEMGDDDDVASRLEEREVDPGRIDYIINSHLHFDHCGGNALVPNAAMIVQSPEWDATKIQKLIDRDVYNPADFDLGHEVITIEGEHDVFGDGSVRCMPTYGHTAGHQSLVVRNDDGEFIFCGDTCYFASTLEQNILPSFGYDLEAQARSLEWLRQRRAEGAHIVFGHDETQWTRLTADPAPLRGV